MNAWADVVLLGLIVAFILSKAIMLGRGGNLGRSMAAFNVTICAAYLWSLSRVVEHPPARLLPDLSAHGPRELALLAIRVAVAATACWGLFELYRLRWPGLPRRLRRRTKRPVR